MIRSSHTRAVVLLAASLWVVIGTGAQGQPVPAPPVTAAAAQSASAPVTIGQSTEAENSDGHRGSDITMSVPASRGRPEDVIESLKSLATGRGLLFIGESPVSKQIGAVTGKGYRHVTVLSFGDVGTMKTMLDHADVYPEVIPYIPFRIAVVAGLDGRLWLHALDPVLLLREEDPLPADLKRAVEKLKSDAEAVMDGAARRDL